MTNQNIPRVERIEKVWSPDARLYVPHEKGEIAFASPISLLYRNLGF